MAHFFLILLLALTAGHAFSHPTEHCLALTAQAASRLKTCHVAQETEFQCDKAQARLDSAKQRCLDERFTPEAIMQAEVYGIGQVDGAVANSPLRKQQEQVRWEKLQMEPNIKSFYRYFPGFRGSADLIEELFHTQKCPRAYEGAGDRWLLAEKRAVLRQSFLAEQDATTFSVWFMGPEVHGSCYPPEVGGDRQPKVINIPLSIVEPIEQMSGNKVVFCDGNSACTAEVSEFERNYHEYQAYFSAYKRLFECREQEEILASVARTLKNIGSRTVAERKSCPDYNIETKLLNVKGYLLELDNQLFQPVTNHSQMIKSK